jgi:YHS domain-containing protein
MNIDPVCGMKVENEQISLEFKEKRYYFRSHGCMEKFRESPAEYTRKDLYDLLIIGDRPEGLTAAVYASISKIDTFLLDNKRKQAAKMVLTHT